MASSIAANYYVGPFRALGGHLRIGTDRVTFDAHALERELPGGGE